MQASSNGASVRVRKNSGLGLVLFAAIGILCTPTSALAWWNHDWAYRKQIAITAGARDEQIKGDLADVPVLIRIHEGVLNFTDASADGADLRFVAEDDKTPLKFHIEKFDSVFNLGFVWVQIPQLKPGEQTKIWMYYGNAKATSGSEPAQTYDSSQTLIYHFGERGTPAADSTSYRNNAAAAFPTEEGGLIGSAAKFDGQTIVALPASASLNVPAGGAVTISLWAKPSTASEDGVLYSHKDGVGGLMIGLVKGSPYVWILDQAGELHQSSPLASPISEKDWHQIAVVVGEQTTLFVDGKPASKLATPLPALTTAATLGGEGGLDGTPVTSGFNGEIDELEISKIARDPGLIQVAAGNQGPSDQMVQFGGDEAQSSWSTGYVGIIMGSVTLDGWVIIGILIIMMVISWYIMARKAVQISRVSRANKAFLQLFRASGSDFSSLNQITAKGSTGGKLSGRDRQLVQQSPLLHMFRTGIEELRQRLSSERKDVRTDYLSSQSIEAIRATIDTSLVQETQSLSSQMVLLTIAISGGPFVGLLGTVIGVMITFAGVAAAGDVNINAIAPGISAALAATVAGMFVAIPALFGYNYLITRIKECSAEMHVFVDTFITRMAESYNSPAMLHAMADE